VTPMDKPPQDPELSEQLARVRAFLRRAARFWPSVVLTLALGALGFGVFSHFRQPTYRSETVILYVERRATDDEARVENAQQAVAVRLKELLFARPNLERVVKQFGLYPETRAKYGMVDAIEELKKHVEFRAPGGDTFSIAFDGRSPSEAQRVTAELARLVIEGDSDLRKSQARVALDFLAGERKTRETELREAEERLASFMAQHPRFALDATPLANGAAIRASMGGTPATPARQWAPAPRSAGAAGPGSLAPTPATGAASPASGGSNAEEARARAALAAANEDLAEKLAHYTPAHPDVKAAEAAVQRANERLAALANAPAPKPVAAESAPPAAPLASSAPAPAPPRNPASIALAPRAATPPPAPAASGRSEGLVQLETEWLQLTRAVTEARQRQDQIEAQLFRADIQVNSERGGHGAQVNVIDPAFLPQRPLPPGRTTIALLFLAGSLLLGVLVALLRAAFDERVLAASDVAGLGEVLAEIPRVMKRRSHAAT
jgi:capsular polysaccharide biosynthesis protein